MIQLLIFQIQTKNIYDINDFLPFNSNPCEKRYGFQQNTTPGFTSPMIAESAPPRSLKVPMDRTWKGSNTSERYQRPQVFVEDPLEKEKTNTSNESINNKTNGIQIPQWYCTVVETKNKISNRSKKHWSRWNPRSPGQHKVLGFMCQGKYVLLK